MFIPRGRTLFENLATSYVLVDALVAHLCEGGFSGVVEVVLRETEAYIVISAGEVFAAIETRSNQGNQNADGMAARTTVAQVAERSRRERGRIAVYAYSPETAAAVAGRVNARALYVGLSTEFTDLQKMLLKLAREKDRQWFVEVNTRGRQIALINMRDGACRIINSTEQLSGPEPEAAAVMDNAALQVLLYECNRDGGTFDVYFTRNGDDEIARERDYTEQHIAGLNERPDETAAGLDRASAEIPGEPLIELDELPDLLTTASLAAEPDNGPLDSDSENRASVAANGASSASAGIDEARDARAAVNGAPVQPAPDSGEGPRASGDDEAMAEVRRMIGEIARSIEEAVQAVAQHDAFSMAFRAGQIRIAERYPFLDPFRGEFEYLGGEIVFVGQAGRDEFVAGLTEALQIAVESIAQSNLYADRLRAYVSEDLQKLLAANRREYEKFGLDRAIERLVSSQAAR